LIERRGFVASPRVFVPVLMVLVALLAVASLSGGEVSSARIVATVVVGTAIVVVFGVLAVLSRARKEAVAKEQPVSEAN
jgi:hypothetical protein